MPSHEFTVTYDELVSYKKRRYIRLLCAKAIKNGTLVRPSVCDACKQESAAIDAHHIDYGRPYDIMWLCKRCHGAAHRTDSALNPRNNPQSSLPAAIDMYPNVSVTINLPTKTFLALQKSSQHSGSPVASIIRDLITAGCPVQKEQLEFNFKETIDVDAQNESNERVQSLGQDEGRVLQREQSRVFPIWSQGDTDVQRVEGRFYSVSARHGPHADRNECCREAL